MIRVGKEIPFKCILCNKEILIYPFKKENHCNSCEKIFKTHWANYSGNYKRDITDFLELCPTCHSAFDRNREILL